MSINRVLGYSIHLTIDLPDGPHDITSCLEIPHGVTPCRIELNLDHLLHELEVEKRTRARIEDRAMGRNDG